MEATNKKIVAISSKAAEKSAYSNKFVVPKQVLAILKEQKSSPK